MDKKLENSINEILSNQIATRKDIDSMRQDIDSIKRELLGNEHYGNNGFKHRIENVELKIEKVERLTFKRIWFERGIIAVVSSVWLILWNKFSK